MKYLLIVGDGMADYPVDGLNGKTPLQVANKPTIDAITSKGRSGLLRTIPTDMEAGSDIANLSILGYDPKKYYSGRGVLEAASKGINLSKEDVAFRCNLVTEDEGVLTDYSADHITDSEARELMEVVRSNLGKQGEIEFHTGVSYRHILILRGRAYSDKLRCTPPHDVMGTEISRILPKAKTARAEFTTATLIKAIWDSTKILRTHPVNVARIALNKRPGNMIWPWSPGKKIKMPTFQEKYRVKGAVISAVDLIKGIGVSAGMTIITVPGATGFYDTNFEGKADYAIKALETHDLVLIHVEAPDEAGHNGDYKQKIKAIENLDKRLIKKLLEFKEDLSIAVLPDHPTPINVRTHTKDPVPFTIYSPQIKPDGVKFFDEFSVKEGGWGLIEGESFMPLFLAAGKKRVKPSGTDHLSLKKEGGSSNNGE